MSVAELPYRLNVGAALFNPAGLVFIGRRKDMAPGAPETWQMPQGGIDAGEDPAAAVLRELEEEIGTAQATILAELPDWLTYDLPPDIAARAFGGRYRGQRQKWFALRFEGSDSDIALDRHAHPEFSDWRWARLAELPGLAIGFKKGVYRAVAEGFARFAAS
jgi:putative (di)nucleoside polyphosphate hydrolase